MRLRTQKPLALPFSHHTRSRLARGALKACLRRRHAVDLDDRRFAGLSTIHVHVRSCSLISRMHVLPQLPLFYCVYHVVSPRDVGCSCWGHSQPTATPCPPKIHSRYTATRAQCQSFSTQPAAYRRPLPSLTTHVVSLAWGPFGSVALPARAAPRHVLGHPGPSHQCASTARNGNDYFSSSLLAPIISIALCSRRYI